MLPSNTTETNHKDIKSTTNITNGIGAGSSGLATKGRYEPTDVEGEDLGWGIVRLYRDAEETPGLYDDVTTTKHHKHGKGGSRNSATGQETPFRDEDCTTLCILAVPAYMTPSDFLGFVGEETREEVSHFRMIKTERVNRYMVLMKFRSGKKAREWRKEWNGKVFNSMEVSLYKMYLNNL
jgi:BRCA1-associated protein